MAGSLSNHAETLILKWLLTDESVSRPAARFVAMHTSAPGENGSLAEVLSLGRKSMTYGAPANGKITSASAASFTTSLQNGFFLSHWSNWDAGSAGNCLGWGTLKTAIRIGGPAIGKNEKAPPTTKTFNIGALLCQARGLTPHAKDLALNWLFRSVAVTRPAGQFLALHRLPPGDGGNIGEIIASGYGRIAAGFDAPAGGVVRNADDLTFGPAGEAWPPVNYYSIWDAESDGNCLMTGTFKEKFQVESGESLLFAGGGLVIRAN